MALKPMDLEVLEHPGQGTGAKGRFYLGDAVEQLEALLGEFEGRVKLVYMDPPFMTGDRFNMRVRVGAEDWRRGTGSFTVETFNDSADRDAFLAMMKRVLVLCRRLLCDEGMIFVHIDYRAHPYVRLLLDEIFGEKNMLNEIIWVYQSGGRSLRHFSRKHDVILFYAKTGAYDFNIDAVKSPPVSPRPNHMRRHVDPDGRVYRSVRVNGKLYTYYDDEPVAPTDVWQDLSHLQQRDPERTGYDAQKPLALLDRIVKCASRPGDWVLDPFAGSCTTLEASKRLGRCFLGIDSCRLTHNIARRRLVDAAYSVMYNGLASFETPPRCRVSVSTGVGFYHVALEDFDIDTRGLPEGIRPMDAIDNWSVGYMRPRGFRVMAEFYRSRKSAELARELALPVFSGELAVCISDVLGRNACYSL